MAGRPGFPGRVPTCVCFTHRVPNLHGNSKPLSAPTPPFADISLRAKGRGGSRASGETRGQAEGLRTYVHGYTHCRGEVAEVMDGASLDRSVAGQSRGQVPLVCSGPNQFGKQSHTGWLEGEE